MRAGSEVVIVKKPSSGELTLIAHVLCPYVQRVAILAIEKSIVYKRIDIDLASKPAWLKTYSPNGQVPVLITTNGTAIFETHVICDYLDTVSDGSLFSQDATQRACEKSWLAFGESLLSTIAKMIYQDRDLNALDESVADIHRRLTLMSEKIEPAPYFGGQAFSLVDAMYATIFRYFAPLNTLLPTRLSCHGLPKLQQWKSKVLERASVVECVPADYHAQLIAFIRCRSGYLAAVARHS
jgi:glutathione S-transferase